MVRFLKVKLESGSVSWFEFDGATIYNVNGGRCALNHKEHVILMEQEAEEFTDLDWTGTSFDDPSSPEGWLAPDGRYYGCSFGSHDLAAEYIFKLKLTQVRKAGHGKVYAKDTFTGKPFVVFDFDVEPTVEQKLWMDQRGISY